MAVIHTGNLSKSLMPGVRQFFGMMYNRFPDEYSHIFEIRNSNKAFEEDVNVHGFSMASVIPQGTDIQYDTLKQGGVQRYIHTKFGKGYIITEEAIDDNQYPELIRQMSQSMGVAMKQTKETVCANVLNRATNSSYVGFDGKELCATDHVLSKGGTQANEFSVVTPLSEVALEQALVEIGGFVDDASMKLQAMGIMLIVPRQLEPEAKRILGSEKRPNTANNDINVVHQAMPYMVNHYLTSATRWFVKTNVPNSLLYFQRKPLQIRNDTDFNSANMRFAFSERYSVGWTSYLGVWGNGE